MAVNLQAGVNKLDARSDKSASKETLTFTSQLFLLFVLSYVRLNCDTKIHRMHFEEVKHSSYFWLQVGKRFSWKAEWEVTWIWLVQKEVTVERVFLSVFKIKEKWIAF
jgi:hypothetical protein